MLANCATSGIDGFEDIVKSTLGVVFLGTPHRGSSVAKLGEVARKVVKLLGADTNPLVLESLSLQNSDLERNHEAFMALWHKYNFKIKTFQEGGPLQLPMKFGASKYKKVSC